MLPPPPREPTRLRLAIWRRHERLGPIIGLYYLIRSVAIAPAATIGGVLWKTAPGVPVRRRQCHCSWWERLCLRSLSRNGTRHSPSLLGSMIKEDLCTA
jgi:hypothetical protein